MKITITEDYNNLKKGEEFIFDFSTIIVGSNGSGKTSLLNMIRNKFDGHYMGRGLHEKQSANVEFVVKYDNYFEYMHQHDYYKGASFADMDYLLSNNSMGLTGMRASAGECTTLQVTHILSKIEKLENSLVLLDEAETSLDLQTQYDIVKVINYLAIRNTFIISTHSPLFIKNLIPLFNVYDMDNREYIKDLDSYLNKFKL